MTQREKYGAVNYLVHQQLRHRLTPYQDPPLMRAARHPGWRWLAMVAGVVVWWGIIYLVYVGGWR